MLQKLGGLYLNNAPWDLTPDVSMAKLTKVIVCQGDQATPPEGSQAYTKKFKIDLVVLPIDYHEYFDQMLLDALMSTV
jgi:hypothetical protein